jgi:transglutaminase-like putative cysteine protease
VSTRLDIRYRTEFLYDEQVSESHNELRACPADDARQRVLDYKVLISPTGELQSFRDYYGTRVDTFGVRSPHERLVVVAESTVETGPPVAPTPSSIKAVREAGRTTRFEYLGRTRHTAWDAEIATDALDATRNLDDCVEIACALQERVRSRVSYGPGHTTIGTPVTEVWSVGIGVCQDYSHLLAAMCRAIGLPARYVSGYLFTTDDAAGTGIEDGSVDEVEVQTHAWVEVGVSPDSWFALDPTNGREVGVDHVKIGHGRDYDDVGPLHGCFSGPTATPMLDAAVDIRRRGLDEPLTPEIRPSDRDLLVRRRDPINRDQIRQQQQQQQQQ